MYELQDNKWPGGGGLTTSLTESVNHLLHMEQYKYFATTKYSSASPDNWVLLEGLHNRIHMFSGGGSLMTLEDDHNFGPQFENRQPNPSQNAQGKWVDQRKYFASGHMCDSAIAAFDTIFWLHHWYGLKLALLHVNY